MSSVFDDGPVLLDGPDMMLTVLRELVGEDALTWRGSIEVWGQAGGSPRWRLHLNDNKSDSIKSRVDLSPGVLDGEYLALVYGRLLVLNADEAQS